MVAEPSAGAEVGAGEAPPFALSMREFVAMMAVLMACTALTVDIMLPSLPDIVADFGLSDPNQQQYMVTTYVAAFAAGHIFAGPLADRYGRRPIILGGLVIYSVAALVAAVADSYAMLLAARALQGLGAAGPRVVAVAVVRDRFVGRTMSQVMSFVLTVFIMLPVVAPTIGSVIAWVSDWRWVFGFLFVFGGATFAWVALRLPETHPRSGVGSSPPVAMGVAVRAIFAERASVGYMIALGFLMGCLLAYVASSQQLFADIYGIVRWFPAVFAIVAGGMVVSSIVNASLVQRLGMRVISHTAAVTFVVLSLVGVVGAALFAVPVWLLVVHLTVAFFLIGIMLPNFNAIAMEPLGRIAGTGASFVGFVMTALGAVLGGIVGQFFDGTIMPLAYGYCLYSVVILTVILLTERGFLFKTVSN
ncbi:MAG: multidrug effflux MFS transporter [Pseudomonadota bacterium]